MTNSSWTSERIATLKSCIARKMSGGRTAQEMGLRVNQVVGKAFRLGLSFNSQPGHKYQKPRGGDMEYRPMPKPNPVSPASDSPHTFVGLDLLQLTDQTCKYPYTEGSPYLFCGNPTDEPPYCKHCRDMCFAGIPPRKGTVLVLRPL